jgi:hypothetical protein
MSQNAAIPQHEEGDFQRIPGRPVRGYELLIDTCPHRASLPEND